MIKILINIKPKWILTTTFIYIQYQKSFLPQGKYPKISSSWKQTGKLPYKLTSNIHQNCHLAISKKEFCNYLLSKSNCATPVLFFICNADITSIDYSYDAFSHYRRMGGKTGHMYNVRVYKVSVNSESYFPRPWYSTRQCDELFPKNNERQLYPWNKIPESFRHDSQKVFFDVLTTYEILKLRETCYDVIQNYAKVKVLEQFNNFFNFFLTENILFCRLYVILKTRSLSINISKMRDGYLNNPENLKEIELKITGIINSW
jgi:hypothetical protein